MSIETWKKEIVDALRSDLESFPDKDGTTHLSRLVDKVKSFVPTSTESYEILKAVVALIKDPVAEFEGETTKIYWHGLINLSKFINSYEKNILSSAFYEKLFSNEWSGSDLRVYALNGSILAGRIFDPTDLERLEDIYDSHPIAWLNAAVFSSNFDMAVEFTKKALQENVINVNALVLSLDGWRRVWRRDINFGDVVTDFASVIIDHEKKNKLLNWMKIRGLSSSQTPAQLLSGYIIEPSIIPNQLIDHYSATPGNYEIRIKTDNNANQNFEVPA